MKKNINDVKIASTSSATPKDFATINDLTNGDWIRILSGTLIDSFGLFLITLEWSYGYTAPLLFWFQIGQFTNGFFKVIYYNHSNAANVFDKYRIVKINNDFYVDLHYVGRNGNNNVRIGAVLNQNVNPLEVIEIVRDEDFTISAQGDILSTET